MTNQREKAVLTKVADSGATRESPLRLRGRDFTVALALFEADLLGMVGSMFHPIESETNSL